MEDVSKAVIEAVDHHAQIINISLSDITDLPQMRRAVDYAESHGSLIISSAPRTDDDSPQPTAKS